MGLTIRPEVPSFALFRRQLLRQICEEQHDNAEAMANVNRSLQLSYLHMVQVIPLAAHRMPIFIANQWFNEEYVFDRQHKLIISHSYQYAYIWFCVYAFNCLAHFLHFYLYLICSKVFRQEFFERVKQKLPCLKNQDPTRSSTLFFRTVQVEPYERSNKEVNVGRNVQVNVLEGF